MFKNKKKINNTQEFYTNFHKNLGKRLNAQLKSNASKSRMDNDLFDKLIINKIEEGIEVLNETQIDLTGKCIVIYGYIKYPGLNTTYDFKKNYIGLFHQLNLIIKNSNIDKQSFFEKILTNKEENDLTKLMYIYSNKNLLNEYFTKLFIKLNQNIEFKNINVVKIINYLKDVFLKLLIKKIKDLSNIDANIVNFLLPDYWILPKEAEDKPFIIIQYVPYRVNVEEKISFNIPSDYKGIIFLFKKSENEIILVGEGRTFRYNIIKSSNSKFQIYRTTNFDFFPKKDIHRFYFQINGNQYFVCKRQNNKCDVDKSNKTTVSLIQRKNRKRADIINYYFILQNFEYKKNIDNLLYLRELMTDHFFLEIYDINNNKPIENDFKYFLFCNLKTNIVGIESIRLPFIIKISNKLLDIMNKKNKEYLSKLKTEFRVALKDIITNY